MTVDCIRLRDVCEYEKCFTKKQKLDYLEIMFCHWRIWTYAIGTNKTIITTEDEESVQKELDTEAGKERGLERTFEENSDHSNLAHDYTHSIK